MRDEGRVDRNADAKDLGTIDTDLLILGGGLAGCMAAIRAKRRDIDVAIVEKAALRRSGCAGKGLDHYSEIAHPNINGMAADDYGRMKAEALSGVVSTRLSVITAKDALKPAAVLEDIGVRLREDDGTLKMVCETFSAPEGEGLAFGDKKDELAHDVNTILYRGADLKIKLAAEVRKLGVRVFERTMVTSLVTKDGAVVGATAVNVRDGSFMTFRAKAVILATGGMMARLYEYPYATFPRSLFTVIDPATNNGDGAAIAFRAGAKVTNLELVGIEPVSHSGIGYSPMCVAYYSRLRNSAGQELFAKYPELRSDESQSGDLVTPWLKYSYMPSVERPELERDVLMQWMDEDLPDEIEDYDAFMHASETPAWIRSSLRAGGIRKAPYEILPWLMGPPCELSGVMRDETGETSLRGLFVAGDVGGALPVFGATGAFVWGYRLGDHLSQVVSDTKPADFGPEQWNQIAAEKKRVMAPLAREDGVDPLELEDLVRKLTMNYVGTKKIEPRLKRGLELIQELKARFVPALVADNPHELMRALEVQNIIEVAELHTYASLLRTESRLGPHHFRLDYPETDDVHWKKNMALQNMDGEIAHTLETLA